MTDVDIPPSAAERRANAAAPLAQLRWIDQEKWRALYETAAIRCSAPGLDDETQAQAAEALGWPSVAQQIRAAGFGALHFRPGSPWPDMSKPEPEVVPSFAALRLAETLRDRADFFIASEHYAIFAGRLENAYAEHEEILDAIETSLATQGRGEAVIEPRMHLQPGVSNGHFNVLRGALNLLQPGPTCVESRLGVGDLAGVADGLRLLEVGLEAGDRLLQLRCGTLGAGARLGVGPPPLRLVAVTYSGLDGAQARLSLDVGGVLGPPGARRAPLLRLDLRARRHHAAVVRLPPIPASHDVCMSCLLGKICA